MEPVRQRDWRSDDPDIAAAQEEVGMEPLTDGLLTVVEKNTQPDTAPLWMKEWWQM
jgi:hypothetical protein